MIFLKNNIKIFMFDFLAKYANCNKKYFRMFFSETSDKNSFLFRKKISQTDFCSSIVLTYSTKSNSGELDEANFL